MKASLTILFSFLALTLAQYACCGDCAPSPELATQSPIVALTEPAAQSPELAAPSPTAEAASYDELCDNDFFPSDDDATWVFKGNNSKTGAYSRTDTVTDSRGDGFTILTKLKDISYTQEFTCTEAGLINLEPAQGDFAALFSGPNGMIAVKREHNSGLTIPRDIVPESTWQQLLGWRINNPASTGSYTYYYTAMGLEVVTVPAGTFDAMRIDVTINAQVDTPGRMTWTYSNSIWLARDIGLVKSDGSSNLRGVEFTDTLELESYDSSD